MTDGKCFGSWNNNNMFVPEYDEKWREHENCSELEGYGVAYKFHRWLQYNDLIDEYTTVDDTWNNLSGCREGNRYDIHDDYKLYGTAEDEDLQISYLYVVNGNLWATVIDKAADEWYADMEIKNV